MADPEERLPTPVESPQSLQALSPVQRLRGSNQGWLIFFALLSSNMFALLVGWIFEFLSLRGVVNLGASRIALAGAWVSGVVIVAVWVWGKGISAKWPTLIGSSVLLAGLLWGLDMWAPKPPPTPTPKAEKIDLDLALITTIHRMRGMDGKYLKGGQNDLVGVLRARRHNGSSIKHIRSLQISGDVPADCQTYIAAFYPDLHGQYSEDQLSQDCDKRKPFLHISWTSFPQSPIKLDGNDEEYARFGIARSMGAQIFHGDLRKFFGFGDMHTRPHESQTVPVWNLLVRFAATNPSDLSGTYPSAREEVKAGQVKFMVALDDEFQEISPSSIRFPWTVSLSDSDLTKAIDAELFNGIQDNGLGPARPDSASTSSPAAPSVAPFPKDKPLAPLPRAVVHITNFMMLLEDPDTISVNVYFKNIGDMQAETVKHFTASAVSPLPEDPKERDELKKNAESAMRKNIADVHKTQDIAGLSVPPNAPEMWFAHIPLIKLSPEQFKNFQAGKVAVFFSGSIEYTDNNGTKGQTSYCLENHGNSKVTFVCALQGEK